MRFQVRESDESCQPGPQYRNPQVVVQEHHGAPLLNCSGLVLVRQLIERLGVARAIDAGVRMLRRCKWYRESDHILTLVYSMLSGGSKLQDVNRLGQDDALKRVLGSDRIPHATTIERFHGALQPGVTGWVGIEHRGQRGTQHARIRTLVTERRADAGGGDPVAPAARDAFDQPVDP